MQSKKWSTCECGRKPINVVGRVVPVPHQRTSDWAAMLASLLCVLAASDGDDSKLTKVRAVKPLIPSVPTNSKGRRASNGST